MMVHQLLLPEMYLHRNETINSHYDLEKKGIGSYHLLLMDSRDNHCVPMEELPGSHG